MKSIDSYLQCEPSNIHGFGLFTSIALKKGTLLGTCDVLKVEVPNEYTLWCDDGFYEVQCILKYINHSAIPNVVYYDDFTVVALRDIAAGEELTHYYSDEL